MKILVCVDFSEFSDRAVDQAVKISQPGRDIISLVHIANLAVKDALTNLMVGFDPNIVDSTNNEKINDAISGLKKIEADLKDKGVRLSSLPSHLITTECTALVGDPKSLLVEEINRQKPDIVVVGQRGLGKLEKFFLGSVSEHLSKHSHASVLIVK